MALHKQALLVGELREFASFTGREQRYIRSSLAVGRGKLAEAEKTARNTIEKAGVRAQVKVYEHLPSIKDRVRAVNGLQGLGDLMQLLVFVSGFDLNRGQISCFGSYRFLYERLIGASVRPWLPSSFCAAAALPVLEPQRRRELLQSISESAATAPGWAQHEPVFIPEWVDKIPT